MLFKDLGLIAMAVLLALVLVLFLTGVWPYPVGWMVLLLFLAARYQHLKLRQRNQREKQVEHPE